MDIHIDKNECNVDSTKSSSIADKPRERVCATCNVFLSSRPKGVRDAKWSWTVLSIVVSNESFPVVYIVMFVSSEVAMCMGMRFPWEWDSDGNGNCISMSVGMWTGTSHDVSAGTDGVPNNSHKSQCANYTLCALFTAFTQASDVSVMCLLSCWVLGSSNNARKLRLTENTVSTHSIRTNTIFTFYITSFNVYGDFRMDGNGNGRECVMGKWEWEWSAVMGTGGNGNGNGNDLMGMGMKCCHGNGWEWEWEW